MGMMDTVLELLERAVGTSALVTLECDPAQVHLGERMNVRIRCRASGQPVHARALRLVITATERCALPAPTPLASVDSAYAPTTAHSARVTYRSELVLATGPRLQPNEERTFVGSFALPSGVQPTYRGQHARHEWSMEARLDVVGVDPTSGARGFDVLSGRRSA